jgi:hypothetical protein
VSPGHGQSGLLDGHIQATVMFKNENNPFITTTMEPEIYHKAKIMKFKKNDLEGQDHL